MRLDATNLRWFCTKNRTRTFSEISHLAPLLQWKAAWAFLFESVHKVPGKSYSFAKSFAIVLVPGATAMSGIPCTRQTTTERFRGKLELRMAFYNGVKLTERVEILFSVDNALHGLSTYTTVILSYFSSSYLADYSGVVSKWNYFCQKKDISWYDST